MKDVDPFSQAVVSWRQVFLSSEGTSTVSLVSLVLVVSLVSAGFVVFVLSVLFEVSGFVLLVLELSAAHPESMDKAKIDTINKLFYFLL